MGLKEELKSITGRKKRFILLRIIDVGTEEARRLCGIRKGTYNTWLHNEAFVKVHQRKAELSLEYKQEALRMLRKENQLQAVLLEEKILEKIKQEIESGEYVLVKTNLAREVYSKLINDLDYQPPVKNLTWEERIYNLKMGREVPQIEEGGEIIDGEIIPETVSFQATEHKEGNPITTDKQGSPQTQKED